MDPEIVEALRTAPERNPHDLAAIRAAFAEAADAFCPADHPDVVLSSDLGGVASGSAPVRLRTYLPRDAVPRGLLLWMHGGAFAYRLPENDDAMCSRLVAATGIGIVSPDYRLAPEHPFPAGLRDCYAALEWMVAGRQHPRLGQGPALVGGASAGGALAAGVALLARDLGGPTITGQVLLYPVTDDRLHSPSMREHAHAPVFDLDQAALMWDRYLGPPPRRTPRYAAVGRTRNLENLPASLVLTAGFDPLRDEGMAFGQRLMRAGADVALHHLGGAVHGFNNLAPDAAITLRAERTLAAFVNECLDR